MKRKFYWLLAAAILMPISSLLFSSCKSGKKTDTAQAVKSDSATVSPSLNNINLPHADTALIPVLAKVLENALDASAKKDYAALASQIIYRGPDAKRYGRDVFNAKNNYEKGVIKVTSDVLNKWNRDVESKDYPRAFEMDQPNGQKMPVLEVIFVSKKNINRKFFGFLKVNDSYKIVDVVSSL